jgi:hypothetical protein
MASAAQHLRQLAAQLQPTLSTNNLLHLLQVLPPPCPRPPARFEKRLGRLNTTVACTRSSTTAFEMHRSYSVLGNSPPPPAGSPLPWSAFVAATGGGAERCWSRRSICRKTCPAARAGIHTAAHSQGSCVLPKAPVRAVVACRSTCGHADGQLSGGCIRH